MLCIVASILAGASYVDTLIGYGCVTASLILLSTLMGIGFKGALTAPSVQSKRRLDAQWAIVTGANMYISIQHDDMSNVILTHIAYIYQL